LVSFSQNWLFDKISAAVMRRMPTAKGVSRLPKLPNFDIGQTSTAANIIEKCDERCALSPMTRSTLNCSMVRSMYKQNREETTMVLSPQQAHDTALRMFLREHDRWTQNAFVLFGALIAIFLVYGQAKVNVAPYWFFGVATLVAMMAMFVVIAIRGSADAWRQTIRDIEAGRAVADPFQIFQTHLNAYRRNWGHVRDFLGILIFFRPAVLTSVTRMYALLAIVAALTFGTMTAISVSHNWPVASATSSVAQHASRIG
jgi:hypothetical protein